MLATDDDARVLFPLLLAVYCCCCFAVHGTQIQVPEWMELESLSQLLVREKEEDRTFQSVEYHYVEIANLLFTYAKDDIPNNEQVRALFFLKKKIICRIGSSFLLLSACIFCFACCCLSLLLELLLSDWLLSFVVRVPAAC